MAAKEGALWEVQFADIEEEFQKRVEKTVWCTMATVDRKGRPRSRIIHPIWEGSTGWILTGRNTLKAKHLESTPFVSLTYWDPDHKQVYADCAAKWDDAIEVKQMVWDLYKSTPPPLGYDPAMFFQSVDNPETGALKLTPWRIELFSLTELASGSGSQIWHA
jgi:general stress protein 26